VLDWNGGQGEKRKELFMKEETAKQRTYRNKRRIQALAWKSVAFLTYKNKKGEVSNKIIEVYDCDDSGCFGFDLVDNHIKRFLYENVYGVVKGDHFEPRFTKTDDGKLKPKE
jgi:hypothetical protein